MRKALKDYSFQDGTVIPRGSWVATGTQATHFSSEYYEDPYAFDPWRFANMRDEDGEGAKHQMVNTSNEYVSFGHGKHAWCVSRLRSVLLARADGVACEARDASSR